MVTFSQVAKGETKLPGTEAPPLVSRKLLVSQPFGYSHDRTRSLTMPKVFYKCGDGASWNTDRQVYERITPRDSAERQRWKSYWLAGLSQAAYKVAKNNSRDLASRLPDANDWNWRFAAEPARDDRVTRRAIIAHIIRIAREVLASLQGSVSPDIVRDIERDLNDASRVLHLQDGEIVQPLD